MFITAFFDRVAVLKYWPISRPWNTANSDGMMPLMSSQKREPMPGTHQMSDSSQNRLVLSSCVFFSDIAQWIFDIYWCLINLKLVILYLADSTHHQRSSGHCGSIALASQSWCWWGELIQLLPNRKKRQTIGIGFAKVFRHRESHGSRSIDFVNHKG